MVIVIIGILSAITVTSLLSSRKKYNAENQAVELIDFMREAQQRSLTQKRTIRVEINSTDRVIRLINENEPADANNDGDIDAKTANNDTVMKTAKYADDNVYIGVVPTNQSAAPVELSPVEPIAFSVSNHPLSTNDRVAVLRFSKNGTVLSKGTDEIGSNSIAKGATIYVWTKRDADTTAAPTVANILRAVTVLGSSGSTKLWKCGIVTNQCLEWTK